MFLVLADVGTILGASSMVDFFTNFVHIIMKEKLNPDAQKLSQLSFS